MKTMFRQKPRQVVTGNAPRNIREFFADEIAVTIAKALEPRVNLAAPAALMNRALLSATPCRPRGRAPSCVGEISRSLDFVVGKGGGRGGEIYAGLKRLRDR